MRKLALLLTVGFFLSATSAIACDGGKTCAKHTKAKSACVCHGKASKAMASKSKSSCTDPKCMKNGHCTKASATPKATPEKG